MKKSVLTLAIMMAGMTVTHQASANHQSLVQRVQIDTKWLSYKTGDVLDHSFGRPVFIERLVFSAEGTCGQYANVSVSADGKVEAQFSVPTVDPNYSIPIRITATSFSLRFDGCLKIKNMSAYVSDSGAIGGKNFGSFAANLDTPAGLAETTLNIVAALQETISDSDFKTYLMPIRKAAIRLDSSDSARDAQSVKTTSKAINLIHVINAAEPLMDNLSNSDFYVNMVETLMLVKERLEELYDL